MKLFVIYTTDIDGDLVFWNNDLGFGDMSQATVYTEEETIDFDLPIADSEPEWLELPSTVERIPE